MAPPATKTYPAPTIPDTPSKAINDMLKQRCDRTFDNPIKHHIAFIVCGIFSAIVKVYQLIHKDMRPSHSKWMASCGIIASAFILGTVCIYYIVLACSSLLHSLLFYGCILIALAGVGLAVSGAVFFDKDGSKQAPGFEATVKRAGYEAGKLE